MEQKLVTLLTDFGTKDGYVGSLKGILKRECPDGEIIDITHAIEPYDVAGAAYVLNTYYDAYPKNTVHLAVVDPGVGGNRRGIIIRTAYHYFVGPDNGLFRFVFDKEAYTAYEIDWEKAGIKSASKTFHARDIFAPVAAKLMRGVAPERLGKKLDARTDYSFRFFRKIDDGGYTVPAVTIDRFGNIISGFSLRDLERLNKKDVNSVTVCSFSTDTINNYYSEEKPGSLIALWNSAGFLEIAEVEGNAAKRLKFNRKKDQIRLIIK